MGVFDREKLPTFGRMVVEIHPVGPTAEEADARIEAAYPTNLYRTVTDVF
jgi:hypothetical protein